MTLEKLTGLEQLNEIRLTENEETKVIAVFEEMYKNEALLEQINTDDVEIMVHVMPLENVLREDVHKQNFSRESLLEGAPEHTDDSWQVPRLVK